MATNTIEIPASRDEVYDVLMDARAYPRWVVGPRRVVSVDDSWPAPGTAFVHEEAIGPLKVSDETELVDVDPRREVRLHANLRPFGAEVEIRIELTGTDKGTRVTMTETLVAGPVAAIWNPLFDLGLKLRNTIALNRLRRLVVRRASAAQPLAGGARDGD